MLAKLSYYLQSLDSGTYGADKIFIYFIYMFLPNCVILFSCEPDLFAFFEVSNQPANLIGTMCGRDLFKLGSFDCWHQK